MDNSDFKTVDQLLQIARDKLRELDNKRQKIITEIEDLNQQRDRLNKQFTSSQLSSPLVTNASLQEKKIVLFRKLFRGREDVYSRRWERMKTGKSGYQPACKNEWHPGICDKPRIKCGECLNKDYLPLTDEVTRNHLLGHEPEKVIDHKPVRDFTIGIYPLLRDETCWFLAIDFDKKTWIEDISAFLDACRSMNVPAALERSRSGTGGHVWIFFSEPVQASLARKLGSLLLTETMERRPEIGLESYDRLFPNQDTLPRGGLGNLIALPLQNKPRERGNSLFLDENFSPYGDQWDFLSTLRRMSRFEVEIIVADGISKGRIIGIRMVLLDKDHDEPWSLPPSQNISEQNIPGPYVQ